MRIKMSLRGSHKRLSTGHIPVMLPEVLHVMSPRPDAVYVDGTFGGGSYSRALLEAASCRVVAIDQDPDAVSRGRLLEAEFPGRFFIFEGRFSHMDSLVPEDLAPHIAGIVLDIGVSSFQIDEAARGFSFSKDGPLDMRMSQEGLTAAEVLNTFSEEELAHIFYTYGEERHSRRIAHRLVEKRRASPLVRTGELRALIHDSVPKSGKIDPATRVFQALRIYVNRELEELEGGLRAATRLLPMDGRLVVVTFHSLEDRVVKNFFHPPRETYSRYLPVPQESQASRPYFVPPQRRPVTPGEEEMALNPRSRSAKLRWGMRTDVPWGAAA